MLVCVCICMLDVYVCVSVCMFIYMFIYPCVHLPLAVLRWLHTKYFRQPSCRFSPAPAVPATP